MKRKASAPIDPPKVDPTPSVSSRSSSKTQAAKASASPPPTKTIKKRSRVIESEDEGEEEVIPRARGKKLTQAQLEEEMKGLEGLFDMDVDENGDEIVSVSNKSKANSNGESTEDQ